MLTLQTNTGASTLILIIWHPPLKIIFYLIDVSLNCVFIQYILATIRYMVSQIQLLNSALARPGLEPVQYVFTGLFFVGWIIDEYGGETINGTQRSYSGRYRC